MTVGRKSAGKPVDQPMRDGTPTGSSVTLSSAKDLVLDG
jgi:hypothetical protein